MTNYRAVVGVTNNNIFSRLQPVHNNPSENNNGCNSADEINNINCMYENNNAILENEEVLVSAPNESLAIVAEKQ